MRTCITSCVHLRHCEHSFNASRVFETCLVTAMIVPRTVVALHRALAYCTIMAVYSGPELGDSMQSRCTVHYYKLLCTDREHTVDVG